MTAISYEFQWVDTNGGITDLTQANGYTILAGVYGLDAPPVELFTESSTEGDGSLLVKRRTGLRRVDLPMYVNTGSTIRTAISHLADVFRGPGMLRVSDDGETYRNLRNVYYETGLEGDEAKDRSMPKAWRKAVVSLQALDPWWYADAEGRSLAFGDASGFSASAIDFDADLPFDGGDTTVIAVPGHADAFPVWTLQGPFDTFSLNVDGVGSFELAAAQADATTITVDTRPGSRGPSLDGAAIDWSLLTGASRLPTLPAGNVSVTVSSSGTDSGSALSVEFEPRWLTP
jgi:hypothetical protein